MANQEHVDLLKRGVEAWSQWRQEYSDMQPDLSGANLSRTNLKRVNLERANLGGANLYEANAYEARFNKADLNGAELSRTNLRGVDLSDADLSGANLSGADFFEANLSGANLSRANFFATNLNRTILNYSTFSHASMACTSFGDVDLCLVKGLETTIHRGPSTIGVDTISRSQGKIPAVFLRDAGVPDSFITYARSLVGQPFDFYSCFISYSSRDETLAKRLHADLQGQGVRCWFAPEDMKIGNKIRARIDEAIHLQDKLLLLLSEHAIASTWVEDEVEAALEKEQLQHREVLFPVRLDEQVMHTSQAWAAKLRRTRHIGDFTNWTDPQAYQQAFERLLRDLKAESNTKGETDGKPGTS